MTKLYLTRHGETESNTKGMLQGWEDSNLTELGVMQGMWLRDRMKELHIDVIYSSPTGRAYETAKIVNGNREIELKTHDGLREINVGNLVGLTQDEFKALDKENQYNFWNVPSKYKAPETGESFLEVRERVSKAVNEILEKEKGKTILIVTHTIALKSYLCELENKDLDELWGPPFIKQTSLTEIDFKDSGYEILTLACMKHHEYSKKEFNE